MKIKVICAIVIAIMVGLVGYGVYSKITNIGGVIEQEIPNLPNYDKESGELPKYILANAYDTNANDFVLPRVTETKGTNPDLSLANYANFVLYSSSGVNDIRGLVQTADYQPFMYGSQGGSTFYANEGDKCSKIGGFKKNDYFFKPSKKSVAYSFSSAISSVKDLKSETSVCKAGLFSGNRVEFLDESNQSDFERYADISYFVVNDIVYKMTFKNGYLKTMDIVFKSIVSNYTNVKNGDTYANFACLNGLVDLEVLDCAKKQSSKLSYDVNILMPFSVSYCSRTNCDDKFVLSDNMNLILS